VKPFFSFYGGKHRLSRLLGRPRYDLVIEPFAGAAGFSVLWLALRAILIDIDPVIIGVWRYLQRASRRDIERLPSRVMHIDDLPSWVCQEERWLIGFWLNHGLTAPGQSMCNWGRNPRWMNNYWGEVLKRRIVDQQDNIRGWLIIEGNYWDAPDVEAHWHIDPPYNSIAGRAYRFHNIDYRGALAPWCLSRRGFIQVCEGSGADWLPFRPLTIIHTHRANGHSAEWIFEQDNRAR
jgi:hypothetical protein